MTSTHPERSSGDGTGRILLWVIAGGLMFWPRLFIIGFAIFSPTIGDAFGSTLLVIVGFLLLPWTTLMYAVMWSIDSNTVSGWEWIVVALSFVVDLYTWALGRRSLQ